MHPLLAREPALLQGAFQGVQPATPPPAEVFFGTTFATATPDTAAGGNLVSAGFTLRRSGDLTRVVTVSVKVAGAAPTPLVAADVQGGLSDVQYRFDPGVSALSLQLAFLAQDLDADHFGEVSLHDATGAAILGGVFDFALVHNHVAAPPVGEYALSPDYTVKAAKHQAGGADSSIVQLAAGLGARLKGGTAVGDGSNGLAVWFKRPTTGGWDATFTVTRTDAHAPDTPGGNPLTEELLLLYFGCQGNGGAFPTDVSAWPATTNPWSHNYRANLKGAALSFFNQTDANDAAGHTIALGIFKGDDTRTNVPGTTVFPNLPNVAYSCVLSRRDDVLTLAMSDGASSWTDSWTAPAGALLTAYADAGNIGLVVTPERWAEVSDLVVSDGIVSANPGTYDLAPDWTRRWVMHTTALATIQQLALGVAAKAGAIVADDGSWVIVSKHVHSDAAPVVGPPAAPLSGWAAAADLLPATDPNYVAVRRASDIPAVLAAGKQYVVQNAINLAGRTYAIGGGGSPGHESYLRGAPAGRDRTAYPIISNGRLAFSSSSTIVRELGLDGCPIDLRDGCSKLQVESNWLSGIDQGYGEGFVNHDGGPSTVRDVLVAFNFLKARTGKISAPIVRCLGPSTGGSPIAVPRVARVRVYGNHYDELRIGPDNPVSGGNSGSSRYFFFGDNPYSDYCDSEILIDHNLFTNHRTAGPVAEFKMTGIRFEDNTIEFGDLERFPWAPGKIGACGEVRIRNSRVTRDPTVAIDAGYGDTVKRNLWIRRSSADRAGNIAIRDGFHEVAGNWGLILPPGVQPPAWASVTAAMGAGDLSVEINNGPLDWRTYPSGRVAGGGQEWENCGKLKIGANLATVRGGLPSGAAQPDLQSELCRIAPTTAGRDDRNYAIALSNMTGTDLATPVAGASTLTIPHRMRAAENGFGGTPEVGCAGWDPSFYGGVVVGGGGDFDASFSYTHRASPAVTDAQGCASLLYFEMVGRGAYPADVSAWTSVQWGHAGDTEYQPNADWVRFTFNTLNTVTPALSAKLRLVVCTGGVITRPSPNEAAATWAPAIGVRYAMRCRKSGNDFQIWATDPRDGTVVTQSWTDATAGAMDHGNFLFRLQPGRWADIESFHLN